MTIAKGLRHVNEMYASVVGQFEIADLVVRTLEEITYLLDSNNDRTRGDAMTITQLLK